MRKDRIDYLVSREFLRPRQPDFEKVKSILFSAKTNASVVAKISLTEDSATVIFRELYESIRQLGDAKWWLIGYEPLNHEVSMEILMEMDIKEKIKLNHLPRLKKIRNDINYRGFRASLGQAKEILDFWNTSGKEILKILEKRK
jgi:hypothetical protein